MDNHQITSIKEVIIMDMKHHCGECPNATVITGSINGRKIGIDELPMSITDLAENITTLVCEKRYQPGLYVAGGFYPRKDGMDVFSLEKPSKCDKESFYVYGGTLWTPRPLYKVEDDCLVRVKEGDIRSPKRYPMEDWIARGIRKSLESGKLYY